VPKSCAECAERRLGWDPAVECSPRCFLAQFEDWCWAMWRLWHLCCEGEAVGEGRVVWRMNHQAFQTLLLIEHPALDGVTPADAYEAMHLIAVERNRPPEQVLLLAGRADDDPVLTHVDD